MDLAPRETVPCPLCQSDDYTFKYTIDSWRIVQCKHCRFVYVNPRLVQQALFNLYKGNYFDNDTVGYLHYRDNKALRKRNFSRWINDASEFVPSVPAIRALDIGCAAGYCLEVFHERGWAASGVELNQAYARELRSAGYNIYEQPFLEIPFSTTYHVVTLFDVVEHLPSLVEHFRQLHAILEENGILILITPDYESMQRKLLGRKWFQFKPIEHIQYFSLGTMRSLAGQTGFEILEHRKAGQFSTMVFLQDRLKKYRLHWLSPLLQLAGRVLGWHRRDIYVDTASLYVVLRKKS